MPSLFALSNQSPTVGLRDSIGNVIDLSTDAFGRLRVSNPKALAGVRHVDLAPSPVLVDNALDAGSTAVYDQSTSSVLLTATVDGEYSVRQTVRRPAYENGKSQLIFVTGIIAAGSPSGTSGVSFGRMGLFDGEQGAYLEAVNNGTSWDLYICLRSGTVTTRRVAQADWNIDRCDGSLRPNNRSGYNLDPTKTIIEAIFFEWLGVGGLGIATVIDNKLVPLHFFANANIQTDVYMRTPNLPVRWEASLDGASLPEAKVKAICCSVISEGGAEETGMLRSDYITSAVAVGNGEIRELLSMRLRCNGTTDGLEAITSSTVFPELIGCVNTSNDVGLLIMGYKPTFTGAGTWADPVGSNGALSHVQICKAGRLVTNPGHVFSASHFSTANRAARGSFDKTIALGCRPKIASGYGVADEVSLMLVNTSGSTTNTLADLTWREVG